MSTAMTRDFNELMKLFRDGNIHVCYSRATGDTRWASMLSIIPEHMREGLVRYVVFGVKPGGFLSALLSNDLMKAFGKADSANFEAMGNWVMFLHNYAPHNCYGSPEKFAQWEGLAITEEVADDIELPTQPFVNGD